MAVSKIKNFFLYNLYPILLFLFFFFYNFFWIKLNLSSAELNTNNLSTAIQIFNYKPHLSYFLDSIIKSSSTNIFLGYCLFPSLVSVILFMIFKKILSNDIWSFSLTFLSLTATENYPFINFLTSFFKGLDLKSNVNLYENFEIMGFPLPSFSIFFFCVVFYLSIRTIKLKFYRILFITFLWSIMLHIHPVDGFIGNFYWVTLMGMLYLKNKISLSKGNITFLFFIYLINLFIMLNQLNFESLQIKTVQSISIYHLFFYFLVPLLLMGICFLLLKIDLYEFYQKFLSIYLLMFIEAILIAASLAGIGFELQMLENRITMFLLHFLYYVPIIYYLSKDEIYYLNNINQNSYKGKVVILLYYIFNKHKNIYLFTFVVLMLVYFILSLKI